ncbi:uncharacterized protein BDW43DRAFT_265367 [Aspergillus alliaceus]|uniref:uncharacterized protein n=1 Tax=Petromyces alliaceus TaxID=209559 RepID=UPI0012A43AE2|nr:uncharacterized protein BDW43DRAFT_265367 [Aspergillus alliaceus]KAB8237391.1 hypothetical protein BDW43DRAFT_265367 [Aspergillus alliaceus]
MFLSGAKDLGMQPSVVAEIIYHFSLKVLLDGADGADPFDSLWRRYHGVYDPLTNEEAYGTSICVESQSRLDIAMAAVSLHITRKAALKSGLFGLLGDAPVQIVDIDDEARSREFQALFREHALEKEPAVQTLFELCTSSRFQTAVEVWRRQDECIIFANMWESARKENLDILGTDPGSAWIPYLSKQEFINMSQYLPNEKHPWAKQARQSMTKLRPRIMVRYCTNECYMKDPPPKYFGT